MEREGSMNGLVVDLEQLSLEKGRPLDVNDLDEDGWRAASEQRKIIELGSLGEGAGGAVTRCVLEGGKTVFALKVCFFRFVSFFWVFCFFGHAPELLSWWELTKIDHHHRSKSRREEADTSRTAFQQALRFGVHLPILWSVHG